MRLLISIIILFLSISCNQKSDIIGHWRPAEAFKTGQDTKTDSLEYRDLLLNSDSTFIAVGLEQESNIIEDWHNGETQKGEWKLSNEFLFLQIEGTSILIKFKILKLTKQEMNLESALSKTMEIRFIRVENFG